MSLSSLLALHGCLSFGGLPLGRAGGGQSQSHGCSEYLGKKIQSLTAGDGPHSSRKGKEKFLTKEGVSLWRKVEKDGRVFFSKSGGTTLNYQRLAEKNK